MTQKIKDSKKWLKAPEYVGIFKEFLSSNAKNAPYDSYDLGYCPRTGAPLHPTWIFTAPKDGIYFLACSSLKGQGSVGFTQKVERSIKAFKWKKNSFLNQAPGKKPCLNYITANGQSCSKTNAKQYFRMRVLMPIKFDNFREEDPEKKWVLVHIRKAECLRKRQGVKKRKIVETEIENQTHFGDVDLKEEANSPPRKRVAAALNEIDYADISKLRPKLDQEDLALLDLPDLEAMSPHDFFNMVRSSPLPWPKTLTSDLPNSSKLMKTIPKLINLSATLLQLKKPPTHAEHRAASRLS